jgi:hypothetical protein
MAGRVWEQPTENLYYASFAAALLIGATVIALGLRRWRAVRNGLAILALVLVPIVLIVADRRRFLAGGLVASALLWACSLIAFGAHIPDLSTQSRLVTAVGIPNLVGLAFGEGGETAALHTIFDFISLLAAAACAFWVSRRERDRLIASAVALLVLVVSLSWAAPWYLLWVLPFAALSHARYLRTTIVLLGVYFILAFMPAAVMLESAVHLRPTTTPMGILHGQQINAIVR